MSSSYIIIGASGGIGSQLVADLESCGHNLLLGYHNEKLDAISSKSKFAPVEATNFDSVMSLVEQGINEFGQIDGLINLPGSIILKPPHLITEKEFHATVDINLKSAFACIRAAGKLMQKSSVLLMSSTAVSIGDFVLAVGGTHLFLNANTVFPELKIATDTVSREMLEPNEACYQ